MLFTENISAKDAMAIEALPEDTAWICIHDEYDPPHKLKVANNTRMLQLTFSDVRGVTPHKSKVYNPMSTEDALQILNFIAANKDKKIIVNCNAGISRSGAICLFIHKTYGHHLKPNFWHLSEPNPFILGTLLIEHDKQKLT